MKRIIALLIGMMLAAVAFAQQEVTINFVLKAGDMEVTCGQEVALGTMQSMTQLLDARLYVSNVRVMTENGEEFPVTLTQDGVWQYEDIALLDFEDATGACQGTPETNRHLVGKTEADKAITGLAFIVGVPEAMNHLDAASAPAPLNLTDMWWTWLSGYKFVRIDLQSTMMSGEPQAAKSDTNATGHGGGVMNGWFIHLGSTGCAGADLIAPPDAPCTNPNRLEVRLESFNPAKNTVVLDLDKLLQRVDVSRSLRLEPPGCMSGVDDPDCLALFTTGFGLSLNTGQQLVDSPKFFSVE